MATEWFVWRRVVVRVRGRQQVGEALRERNQFQRRDISSSNNGPERTLTHSSLSLLVVGKGLGIPLAAAIRTCETYA